MDVTAATENTQNPEEALTAFRNELAGMLKSERFRRRDDGSLADFLTHKLSKSEDMDARDVTVSEEQIASWRAADGNLPLPCGDVIDVLVETMDMGSEWLAFSQRADNAGKYEGALLAKDTAMQNTSPAPAPRAAQEEAFFTLIADALQNKPPFAGKSDAEVAALLLEEDPSLGVTEEQIADLRQGKGELPEDNRLGKAMDDLIKKHQGVVQEQDAHRQQEHEETPTVCAQGREAEPEIILSGPTRFQEVMAGQLNRFDLRSVSNERLTARINGHIADEARQVTEDQVKTWKKKQGALPHREVVEAMVTALKIDPGPAGRLKQLWNHDPRRPAGAEQFDPGARRGHADAARGRRSGGHEARR